MSQICVHDVIKDAWLSKIVEATDKRMMEGVKEAMKITADAEQKFMKEATHADIWKRSLDMSDRSEIWVADVEVIRQFKEAKLLRLDAAGEPVIPHPMNPELSTSLFLWAHDFEYQGIVGQYHQWKLKTPPTNCVVYLREFIPVKDLVQGTAVADLAMTLPPPASPNVTIQTVKTRYGSTAGMTVPNITFNVA